MGVFDQILEKVDETDRAVLNKHPFIKATIEDMDTRLGAWNKWSENNIDPATRLPKRQVQLQSELEAERARVAALEARGEVDMTFDEMIAQAKPVIKQQTDEAVAPIRQVLFDDKGNPRVATSESLNQVSAGMQFFYAKTATLPNRHYREFGEEMDFDKYIKYTGEKNLGGDPQTAYDQFVAEKREAKRKEAEEKKEAEHKAELEKVKTETAAETESRIRREAGMSSTPTDSGSGRPPSGWVGTSAEKADDLPEIPKDSTLGDGTAARLGLEWTRKQRQKGTAAA